MFGKSATYLFQNTFANGYRFMSTGKNPKVFMDISIGGAPSGRIVMEVLLSLFVSHSEQSSVTQ